MATGGKPTYDEETQLADDFLRIQLKEDDGKNVDYG